MLFVHVTSYDTVGISFSCSFIGAMNLSEIRVVVSCDVVFTCVPPTSAHVNLTGWRSLCFSVIASFRVMMIRHVAIETREIRIM